MLLIIFSSLTSSGGVVVTPPTPSITIPKRIAWLAHPNNLVPSATVTADSEASGYPVTNLQALPVLTYWRSADSSSLHTIEIDFGSAASIDVIALVNHNLSETATI